jgi:predicted nucleotidyltransferase
MHQQLTPSNECRIVTLALHHQPALQAGYQFGSHASEQAWPGSDVDIALLLPVEEHRLSRMLAASPLRSELTEALQHEVDLVDLRLASTVLQNEVIHTGRRIFTASEDAVLAFEMQVLSAHQKLNEERKEIIASFMQSKRAYAL